MVRLTDRLRRLLQGSRLLEHAAGMRVAQRSYSQFGEDLVIKGFYDRLLHEKNVRPNGGVILDIGAFRPIALSNSYFFYRQGFFGINVDAAPGSKRIFDRTRPRDTNIEVAIGLEDGIGTFYVFGTPSVWNTMDSEAANYATRVTGIVPTPHRVPIRRVETILDQHLRGRPFEMLLIDAEGLDTQVIESNNFEKYRPRVLLFEVGSLSLDSLVSHPMVDRLKAFDYSLYSWVTPNMLFVRNDSLA